MPVRGFDKFREKLPALSGYRIAVLPLFVLLAVAAALEICLTFDGLPATLDSQNISAVLLSFLPLLGVLTVECSGFLLVWQMWIWRNRLKGKYGQTSYQRIFLVGFGGVAWLLTVAVNQYLPFYSFAASFWATSPLQILATPLEAYIGVAAPAVLYVRDAFAAVLLVVGLLMFARALQAFGMDYMAVVYLYFPGGEQDSGE